MLSFPIVDLISDSTSCTNTNTAADDAKSAKIAKIGPLHRTASPWRQQYRIKKEADEAKRALEATFEEEEEEEEEQESEEEPESGEGTEEEPKSEEEVEEEEGAVVISDTESEGGGGSVCDPANRKV